MKKAITLCTLLITLFPGCLFAAQTYNILLDLTYDQPNDYRQLSGYHLYKDGSKVCTENNSSATSMDCTFDSNPGTYDFTITAHFTNGTESDSSDPYTFSLESDLAAQIDTIPINLSGEVPFSVSFDASGSTGTISSYSWTFGDNATGSGINTSHTYTAAGTFNATLTTTDNLGNISEKIVTINTTNPSPTTASYNLHIQWTHEFTGTVGKQLAGYHLYKEGTKICTTTDSAATSMDCNIQSAEGTFDFTLTAYFTDNSETPHSSPYSFSMSPVSEPGLVAKITAIPVSLSGDIPLTVDFNGTSSTGDIVSYTWDFDDNSTATGPEKRHVYSTAGTYNAVLIIKSSSGAVSQSSVTVNATQPSVSPNAVITSSALTGDAPLAVTFNGTDSTNTSSYLWSFGDGDSSSSSSPTHTFTQAGTYTTTLTAKNSGGSDQSTVTVIVKEAAPASSTAPVAVISTSTAVGQAPFAVTFDGTGSSAKEGTLNYYKWNFGDGTSSVWGKNLTHTYTLPGQYTATLTVRDTNMSTNSVTTPIIITVPTEPNEPPVARLTSNLKTGPVPLAVNFSGKNSTDPENGSLTYMWNFGDGVSEQGIDATHEFSKAGTFTVSLTVTDDSGASSTATSQIIAEEESTAFHIELDELQVTKYWQRVNFTEPFSKPVVIAGPISSNEGDPAIIRLRRITSKGFDIRLQEWAYLNGTHAKETVSYLVMEQGRYTLDNGAQVEAGTFTTKGSSPKTVQFTSGFSQLPVLITSLASYDDTRPAASRVHSLTNTKFSVGIHEEEKSTHSHELESISYIAWEPTSTVLGNMKIIIDKTDKVVKHKWYSLKFDEQFTAPPLFLAAMSPQTGSNTASLRQQNLTNSSIDLKVEEETSKDTEVRHSRESIGYFIFSLTK